MKATKRNRGRPPKISVPSATLNLSPPPPMQEESPRTKIELETSMEVNEEEASSAENIAKMNPETLNRKLWVDVLTENRNKTKGLEMKYIAPTVIDGRMEIEIDEEDANREALHWKNSLIMYVLGEDLSMHSVKNFMTKTWNYVQLPNIFYHDEGYFILRFNTNEAMESLLMKGRYTYRGMPMILKEWRKGFNLKKDLMRTIPIWVKFPLLPLHLWGKSDLSKLASAIGIPFVTDECTASKLRVSYARVLIEVDITQKLVEEISIKDKEGNTVIQGIEYEWRPKFYDKCQAVGHNCEVRIRKNEWRPKNQPTVAVPRKETVALKTHGIVKTTDTVTTPKRISTDSRNQSLAYGST